MKDVTSLVPTTTVTGVTQDFQKHEVTPPPASSLKLAYSTHLGVIGRGMAMASPDIHCMNVYV